MSIFAVTLAPLMEELFFRGFLYPVLARRLGVGSGIFLTSAAFAVLHGAQLKYSWAVLIIFLVGLALTIVRAVTKSVAACFLLHVGDRKSTRLNSSHRCISYAVFCLKKKMVTQSCP